MEAGFEPSEHKTKRRKLSTKKNLKTSVQSIELDSDNDSDVNPDTSTSTGIDEDFANFRKDLLSCHLQAIGNCDWRTLGEFPKFQAELSDEEEDVSIVEASSSGLHSNLGQKSRPGPSGSRCELTSGPLNRKMDKLPGGDSKPTTFRKPNDARPSISDRVSKRCASDGSAATAVPKRNVMDAWLSTPREKKVKLDGAAVCTTGDDDVILLDDMPSTSSNVPSSSSSTSLACCPICQFGFPISMAQIDMDAHLAACLAAASDDITW